MKTPITPELKDILLKFLCENCSLEKQSSINGDQSIQEVLNHLNLKFDELNAILTYFQRKGLISDLNARSNYISFILNMEANDFKQQGGFVLQETILKKNLEQLLLEMEVLKKQLKPDQLETINKLSSITGVIINTIATYSGLA